MQNSYGYFLGYYGGGSQPYPNIQIPRYDQYIITYPNPIVNYPVTLEETKEWLKDIPDDSEDDLLYLLIDTASLYFESYTHNLLITKSVRYYENLFYQVYEFTLGKFQSLVGFQYINGDDQLVSVDSSLYNITDERGYWRIAFKNIYSIPKDLTDTKPYQKIMIDFTAGFGPTSDSIPSDIKVALLNHIAAMYENRGDCDTCNCSSFLPATSKGLYNKYRTMLITGNKFRGV